MAADKSHGADWVSPSPKRNVALIGECLIELSGKPFGTLHQSFGGDSLNTALYLARLARDTCRVRYITALGTDQLSDGMVRRWGAEGIDTGFVLRDASRLPGVYLIQVDSQGERSFLYWRTESAARYLLQHPRFHEVAGKLAEFDLIYLSGVSLAILPPRDRATLIDILRQVASRGTTLAFDSNYRASLWTSADSARVAIRALLPAARLLFVTFDDENRLWGDVTPQNTVARLRAAEVPLAIIKLGASGCLCSHSTSVVKIPAARVDAVVDTTAAGDAFNAAFIAAWLKDRSLEQCCRIGTTLAAEVIQYQGAIIPAAATPSLDELYEKAFNG
jgi:2-dehydro-3-deoxygluconokinase